MDDEAYIKMLQAQIQRLMPMQAQMTQQSPLVMHKPLHEIDTSTIVMELMERGYSVFKITEFDNRS